MEEKKKFGCIGGAKRDSLTLPTSPLHRGMAQLRAKSDLPHSDLSHRRKGEHVSEHPAAPAVHNMPKGLLSLLLHPEYRIMSYVTVGKKKWGESQIQLLKDSKRHRS